MNLAGVHCDEVGCSSVWYGKKKQRHTYGDALEQNEPVERQLARHLWCGSVSRSLHLAACAQRLRHPRLHRNGTDEACHTHEHAADEYLYVSEMVVHEQSCHRAECHSNVVCQSVIAQSLTPAAARHYIDTQSVASDCHSSERHTMQCPEGDEPRYCRSCGVGGKHHHAHEVAEDVYRLARKAVHEKSGERSDTKTTHRVTAKDGSDDHLLTTVCLLEIERQHRHKKPEAEEQEEVGSKDTYITPCEQFVFCHSL